MISLAWILGEGGQFPPPVPPPMAILLAYYVALLQDSVFLVAKGLKLLCTWK